MIQIKEEKSRWKRRTMQWFLKLWLLVYFVGTVNAQENDNQISSVDSLEKLSDTSNKLSSDEKFVKKIAINYRLVGNSTSDSLDSFYISRKFNSPSDFHQRSRRSIIVQASASRLIDEKQCPEIRNLCSSSRDGSDDLSILECIQTFLLNQIESLSDDCQHAIWTHTWNIMSDKSVLKIVEKPCQTILGKIINLQ